MGIEHEDVKLGAKFIKVLCSDSECHVSNFGEKQFFYEHNGYSDSPDITPEQLRKAQAQANQHLSERPLHRIRIIKGK